MLSPTFGAGNWGTLLMSFSFFRPHSSLFPISGEIISSTSKGDLTTLHEIRVKMLNTIYNYMIQLSLCT